MVNAARPAVQGNKEPENPDYFKNPATWKKCGTRDVIHAYADGRPIQSDGKAGLEHQLGTRLPSPDRHSLPWRHRGGARRRASARFPNP